MIAPPSLGALPLVPLSGSTLTPGVVDAGSAGPAADPFDEVFLISVLRDELGADIVELLDLPLAPIAVARTPADSKAVDPAAGHPVALLPFLRGECRPGSLSDPLPGHSTDAWPEGVVPASEESDDQIIVVVPAQLPTGLPLVKPSVAKAPDGGLVAPNDAAQDGGATLPAAAEGDARGIQIDAPRMEIRERPRQNFPNASAHGGTPDSPDALDAPAAPDVPAADGDRTTFAGGEGGKVAAKSLLPAPSIWTAPPITRLEVPSTTWRADVAKSREAQELLTSKIGEGGAHVVVTHAGALAASLPSVTSISPIAGVAFHTTAPSVTTTRNDTTVAGENAERIVQSIRLQWARGGGEARITLEPSHLGELTVTVKVDQGGVAVRLQAETPLVREWLQSHAPTLRQGLAEHQLTLDRLEIAGPANADPSRDRDHPSQRQFRDFRDARDSRDSRRDRRPGDHATFDLEA